MSPLCHIHLCELVGTGTALNCPCNGCEILQARPPLIWLGNGDCGMCWAIKANDKWCDTVGSLRKALYPRSDALVFRDGYSEQVRREDCCLCPLDWQATADALGLTLIKHDGDFEAPDPTPTA